MGNDFFLFWVFLLLASFDGSGVKLCEANIDALEIGKWPFRQKMRMRLIEGAAAGGHIDP